MPPTSTKASFVYPDDISGFLCLPPVSDDLQVLWSRAELTEDLDDHPQLIHTFSFFPYPSMPEIALLSLRLGLQMEKVKNWFMVQRIRCGISWSPEEIEDTRARLDYNQEQLHFKPLMALAKKSNVLRSEEFSIPLLKARARQAMAAQAASSPDFNASQPKMMRLSCKLPDKEAVGVNESTPVNRRKSSSRGIIRNFKQSPISRLHPKARHDLDCLVNPSNSGLILGADAGEMNSVVSYYPSGEQQTTSSWHISNGEVQAAAYVDQNGNLKREENAPGVRRQRKSKQQLHILKSFFLKCQWATREDYMRLEQISGLPRSDIIQWFGDTRYALKHGQLRWFRNSMQACPAWLDDSQQMGSVNGRHSEFESPAHTMSSAIEVPDDDDDDDVIASSSQHSGKTIVSEEISDDEPSFSGKSKPVHIASSSQHSGKTIVSEEISDDEPSFSGKSKPVHKVSNFKLLVKNCSKPTTPPLPISSSLQRKYDILENYLCVKQHFHEQDLEALVTESGLSPRQVLDWFSSKSKDPDEVEICVVEDDDDEEEEDEDYDDLNGEGEEEIDDDDDDDVVIQD